MVCKLWNLAARSDADVLVDALERSGFTIRRVDTADVNSKPGLCARFGETFDFTTGGWDSFADNMWDTLLPNDDEGDKVALVWDHSDSLLDGGLETLLQAMDALIDIGRRASAEKLTVIIFLLGDGSNFPRVDLHDMFPNLTLSSVGTGSGASTAAGDMASSSGAVSGGNTTTSASSPPSTLVRQKSSLAAKVAAKMEKHTAEVERSRTASMQAAEAEPTPPPVAPPPPPTETSSAPQTTSGSAHAATAAAARLSVAVDGAGSARRAGGGSAAEMEAEARDWIGAIVGTPLEGSLQEALKSGTVLCTLVNTIKPGCCKSPSNMAAPFKQMENIGNYLAACKALGQRPQESFQTVDLYEDRNMGAVVIQLHSLGRLASSELGFEGPRLGAKVAEKNERHFTEAQLAEARGVTTFLGKGSSGTVGGDMSKAHVAKVYNRASFAGLEGLGTGGEETLARGKK